MAKQKMNNQRAFIFSFLLALTVIALDTFYHLLTGVLVHFYYTFVKFLTVFLTALFVSKIYGTGRKQGIIISIAAPLLFYIHYRFYFYIFAGSFWVSAPLLGDSISMSIVHVFLIGIAYFAHLKCLYIIKHGRKK